MTGTQEPLRIVFDCNIFIQAALYPNGPAAKCLERIEQGAGRLYWSEAIIAELKRVLGRPRMRHKL